MKNIRTRFAPSPTGLLHIGNIRTALFNYLFSQKNAGTFVLRIEDTDPKRNYDEGAKHIIDNLQWLGLSYQEGPEVEGPYKPYFQSQRSGLYKKNLELLKATGVVYKCFCSQEELELKKQRQIALKKPPRYDKACAKLSEETVQEHENNKRSFVWRVNIDHDKTIEFIDLARGTLKFDLKNFSDFPLTREDGSFTFMFANCIDDIEMNISHVLRGEDHLTNTVGQVVLFQALEKPLPTFWHLPILCNLEGKKLSKRDKGFSLEDLRAQGFLPEAICNYLGIIGGSFKDEILSLDQLTAAYNFESVSSTSQIRYDIEKLRWINHKWINTIPLPSLVTRCLPFLKEQYSIDSLNEKTLECLLAAVRTDLITLQDSAHHIEFYFKKPQVTESDWSQITDEQSTQIILDLLHDQPETDSWETALQNIKAEANQANISNKTIFSAIRLLTTGSIKGIQVKAIFECLGSKEFFKRLKNH